MPRYRTLLITSAILSINLMMADKILADNSLYLAYPPENHQTTSERIFFIGSSSPSGQLSINGQIIHRSKMGYFAPSFPLKIGNNEFILREGDQMLKRTVTRLSSSPSLPDTLGFAPNSLSPNQTIRRRVGESICFEAIALPEAQVSVLLEREIIPLVSNQSIELPPNSAVLTHQNTTQSSTTKKYQGCHQFTQSGNLGIPIFQLTYQNQTTHQSGAGTIEILSENQLKAIEIIAEVGVTRTGPGSDYSRLTPLPKGTQAMVTGQEGDWLRLDYGAWIQQKETQELRQNILPKSIIRGISSEIKADRTAVIFPLQIPVPVTLSQESQKLTLTLHNTIAQTDTIYLSDDPLIERLDWQQITPDKIQYTFHFKKPQQWGYDVKYEGTNLILSLRHPPQIKTHSLKGITLLIDPGHGGDELGSKGPTGYPEKAVNLAVSQLLAQELRQRGATIYLTRESDENVSLNERIDRINQQQPNLALSIHYNALPDGGDAMNTAGIGAFWYHPQAHSLAQFLHQYLVKHLDRPSYGVYWHNLALTRPHTTPSILLELGFMINPQEFEWIINTEEQKKLAKVLADGIEQWLKEQS